VGIALILEQDSVQASDNVKVPQMEFDRQYDQISPITTFHIKQDFSLHWNYIGKVFSNASHGDPSVHHYAVTGAVFFLGGSPIHWISRKQKTLAHSSTEAELIAASTAAQDALWIAWLTPPQWVNFSNLILD
jgi:hypothetical protein